MEPWYKVITPRSRGQVLTGCCPKRSRGQVLNRAFLFCSRFCLSIAQPPEVL